MNKNDRMFALIHKDGSKLYPYKKSQLSTNRYGYALTQVGEQDRNGGGKYVDDIEVVIKKLVLDDWNVRAKTLDRSIKYLEGSYGIGKVSIVGYELDSSLWHLVKFAKMKPINFDESLYFNSTKEATSSSENEGDKVLRSIKERRGQAKFREALMLGHHGKCCISGSSVVEVLEAAHIIPHSEITDYSVSNGLLLRADLHTLYDLNLIGIDGNGQVHVSTLFKGSEYWAYNGIMVFEEIPKQLELNLSTRFADFTVKSGS